MAGMLVTTLAESAGSLMVYETSNATNTRTKIDLGTSANAVEISLVDLGRPSFADMYPELLNAVPINPDISSSVLMPYLG